MERPMEEELEVVELDFLRRKALSTLSPKKKGGYRKPGEHDRRQVESEFGIDELLGDRPHVPQQSGKMRPRRQGRATPELSREVIESFSRSRRPLPLDTYPAKRARDPYKRPKEAAEDYNQSDSRKRHQRHAPTLQGRRANVERKRRSVSSNATSRSSETSRSSYSSSRSSSRSRSVSSSSSHSSYSRSRSSSSDSSFSRSRSSFSRSRSRSPGPVRDEKSRSKLRYRHSVLQPYGGSSGVMRIGTVSKRRTSPYGSGTASADVHHKWSKQAVEGTEQRWRRHPSHSYKVPRKPALLPAARKGRSLSPGGGDCKEGLEYRSSRRMPPPLSHRDTYEMYPPPRSRHSPPRRRSPPRRLPDYRPSRHVPPPPAAPLPPYPPSRENRVVRHVTRRYSPSTPRPRDAAERVPRHVPLTYPLSSSARGYTREQGRHASAAHQYRARDRDGTQLERRSGTSREFSSSKEVPRRGESALNMPGKRGLMHRGKESSAHKGKERRESDSESAATDSDLPRTLERGLKDKRKTETKKERSRVILELSASKIAIEQPKSASESKEASALLTPASEAKSKERKESDADKEAENGSEVPGKDEDLVEEELDYDESMEGLDLHPTGSLEMEEHDKASESSSGERMPMRQKRRRKSEDNNFGEYSSPEFASPRKRQHTSRSPCSEDKTSPAEGEDRIMSPIRVSPDRGSHRSFGIAVKLKRLSDSKLPVKERLYVSKLDIEHKKRLIHHKDDSSTSRLRPSLADRLGPSPFGGRHDDYPRTRTRLTTSNRPSKGSAIEIAKAYRRKKQQMMREDEVVKAKNLAKMLNEPDHAASRKTVEPIKESVDKEQALDRRINEIKQQNKAILRRENEIRKDKELYS